MIVVFGSINIDLIINVPRLPKAGETVLGPGYVTAPGGKGANQALAAARAGVAVRMAGGVGRDPFAGPALASLEAAGVDLSAVTRAEGQPTGCAIVCVDAAGENQIIVAAGANGVVKAEQVPDAWLGADMVLVLQMEVPHGENWRLIERARRRGARVLLNVAPSAAVPPESLRALSWLVVNEYEALAVAQSLGQSAADPLAAGRAIAAAAGVATIVTLGSAGAAAFDANEAWQVEALPITPVDTTGAGDAFVGVFAAAMDEASGLPASLRRASVAAGLACLVPGAQPSLPTDAAIAARLTELAPPTRLGLKA